jgi:hypothetical protein
MGNPPTWLVPILAALAGALVGGGIAAGVTLLNTSRLTGHQTTLQDEQHRHQLTLQREQQGHQLAVVQQQLAAAAETRRSRASNRSRRPSGSRRLKDQAHGG